MIQDDIPGVMGAPGGPGGSGLPPAPKRVIKQQNNGPEPWFKVPKRDGICSFLRHLGPFGSITTAIFSENGNLSTTKKKDFWGKFTFLFTQTTRCNFLKFREFSIEFSIYIYIQRVDTFDAKVKAFQLLSPCSTLPILSQMFLFVQLL